MAYKSNELFDASLAKPDRMPRVRCAYLTQNPKKNIHAAQYVKYANASYFVRVLEATYLHNMLFDKLDANIMKVK